MAKKTAAVVEAPPAEEKDYTKYAGKDATDLQARFSIWLKEKVGLTFASKKEEAAFDEGVRLGVALRIPFQASPENQAVRAEPKPEKEAPAPKPAKAAKKAKPAPVVEPDDDDDDAVAEDPAPAKAKRGPRKVAGSKAAPF